MLSLRAALFLVASLWIAAPHASAQTSDPSSGCEPRSEADRALQSLIEDTQQVLASSPLTNPLAGLSDQERERKVSECNGWMKEWQDHSLVGGDIQRFRAAMAAYEKADCRAFLDAHYKARASEHENHRFYPRKSGTLTLRHCEERDPRCLKNLIQEIENWDAPRGARESASRFVADLYGRFTQHAGRPGGDAQSQVIFQADYVGSQLRFRWWDRGTRQPKFNVWFNERSLQFGFPVDFNPPSKR